MATEPLNCEPTRVTLADVELTSSLSDDVFLPVVWIDACILEFPLGRLAFAVEKLAFGSAHTVIVNIFGAPMHVIPALVISGVTVIMPEIVPFVLFWAENGKIVPAPMPARPIAGLLHVHLKMVPEGFVPGPVKFIWPTVEPLQIEIEVGLSTPGVCTTVADTVEVAVQPVELNVTVTV